jgi:hypothetical protein
VTVRIGLPGKLWPDTLPAPITDKPTHEIVIARRMKTLFF